MHLNECIEVVNRDSFMLDVSNNSMSKLHCHPFLELVYVVSGRVEHTLDRKTMIIRPGDYFLINFNSKHSYKSIPGTGDFRIINCMFMPEFIDPTLANIKGFQDILNNYLVQFGYQKFANAPTQSIYHDNDGRMLTLVKQMLIEYEKKNNGYRDVIRYLLLSAIIFLVRNEAVEDELPTNNVTRYIKQYVAKNYMKPLHMSEICAEMNHSLSNISKIFKKNTGMNFRDYLQKIRIEKACQLLKTTDKTIVEISELVGYSDPAFFYRSFKKILNITPYEYRQSFDIDTL
ncbi:MAG: AraC family transcriptional regulator [Clostridia bacterium]|nr:AraC family transcriptional regulator [Clostridia bacterium]